MTRNVDREGPIHRSIMAFLRAKFPKALIHHSANESHLRGKAAMMASVRKKRDGMLSGFPDILVIHDGRVMAFEVKAPRNYASKAQKEVGELMQRNGARWAVVRSIDDVEKYLLEWCK